MSERTSSPRHDEVERRLPLELLSSRTFGLARPIPAVMMQIAGQDGTDLPRLASLLTNSFQRALYVGLVQSGACSIMTIFGCAPGSASLTFLICLVTALK